MGNMMSVLPLFQRADKANVGWLETVIADTHREVDRIRAEKKLPPWEWKDQQVMNEAIAKLREKYPFIVMDGDGAPAENIENIRVDGILIKALAKVCIRCGKERHQRDCKGFCVECKRTLGIWTYTPKKDKTGAAQDREFLKAHEDATLREKHAAADQVSVDRSLIEFAWKALSDEQRDDILLQLWNVAPLAEKAKYIHIAIATPVTLEK